MTASDPEIHQQIVDLTHKGLSSNAIALQLGVNDRTVHRVRRKRRLAKPCPPKLSDDEKRRAKDLLDDGASYKEVGRTLNRADRTIARALPGYTMTKAQVAEIAAMGRWMARIERQETKR